MLEKGSSARLYTAADPAPKSIDRKRLRSFEYLDTTVRRRKPVSHAGASPAE